MDYGETEEYTYVDPNLHLSSAHHIENLYRSLFCLPAKGDLSEKHRAALNLFGDDVHSFCVLRRIDPELPFDDEMKVEFAQHYFSLSDKKQRAIDIARAGTTYTDPSKARARHRFLLGPPPSKHSLESELPKSSTPPPTNTPLTRVPPSLQLALSPTAPKVPAWAI